MAEDYEEPYHVPQQSRRDKLRILAQTHPQDFYDNPSFNLSSHKTNSSVSVVKSEVPLLMAPSTSTVTTTSGSTSNGYNPYLDLQSSSLPLNPTSLHHINHTTSVNPFLFNQLRHFDSLPLSHNDSFNGQGLSLSLSSHYTHQHNNLPLELNLQKYYGHKVTPTTTAAAAAAAAGGDGSSSGGYIVGNLPANELSKSTVPLVPFTGYVSILKGSKFLKPAQQLLEEFCDVGKGIYTEKITLDSFTDPPIECLNACDTIDDPLNSEDGGESRRKKSRLISMLNEVYKRYKHYYQQMQAVVASFECVAGLSNAAPYAHLALKTMSKHFRSLKSAISDQLQLTNEGHGILSHGKEESIRYENIDKAPYAQKSGQSSGFIEHHPVWRPQRGLPERAVTVLRAWLFEHFLHPYPKDTDKIMLAKQTGLSRGQVSNWFVNARVRLWKPMVEELESQQAHNSSLKEDQNANKSSDQALSNSAVSDNPSTSTQRVQEVPSKRTRNELPDFPPGNTEPLNLSYNNMSNHPAVGVGICTSSGSGGVSLTLGLHQNNGIGLSESFPMNPAQHFGLGHETSNEGFIMDGFEVQHQQFGRNVIGGQLLHDFIG